MKMTIKENYRITIEPRNLGDYGFAMMSDRLAYPDENKRAKEYEDRCNEIVSEIKRHVNNIGSICVEFDEKKVCSFCGYDWEVNDNPDDSDWELGEPVCCKKAQEEWKLEKVAKQAIK